MSRPDRQEFNTFVRLDEVDPDLNATSGLEIYSVTMRVRDDRTMDLVLDPMSLLCENVPDIGRDWPCTVVRPNGGDRIDKGPRHLVALFLVMRDEGLVSVTVYRRSPALDSEEI
jgi:hypothetical protein